MSERSETLARQFEAANAAFIAAVAGLSAEQWTTPLGADPRTAGVVAHHVASSYDATLGALQATIAGAPVHLTWAMIDAGNAEHAAAHGAAGKEETLALLRTNGATTAAALRGLSDADLDQMITFSLLSEQPMPAQALAEGLVVGHIGMHAGAFGA
jgi:DinB superfamily